MHKYLNHSNYIYLTFYGRVIQFRITRCYFINYLFNFFYETWLMRKFANALIEFENKNKTLEIADSI